MEPAATRAPLRRHLRTFDLTLLGVGAIIGGGVFASIGTAAIGSAGRPGAGPSLSLGVLLTALACLLTALCYSELAARLPHAGSAYAYAGQAFGRPLAFTVGWCLTLEYAVANVAVALSWGDYAAAVLAWVFGPALLQLPQVAPILGALCILALTLWLSGRSARRSASLTNALVLLKVAILLLFVGVGLAVCGPAHLWVNWHPYMPNGFSGTLYGAATMFFAFIGFDAVATAAEEAEAPQRSLPRAICGSLAICALLYMAVAAVLTGILPLPALQARLATAQRQPMLAVLEGLGTPGAVVGPVVALGALVAQTTALLAFQLAQARIFFAMGRDGALPVWLGRVHPLHHTPAAATWTAGALVGGATLLCPIDAMLDLADLGTLFIFCITNLCLPFVRASGRGALSPRFVAPGGRWLCPVLGSACCLTLMLCLPLAAWMHLLAWIGLGWGMRRVLGWRSRSP